MSVDLMEWLRNLYGAGGGAIPGPAWTATVAALLWMTAYDDALVAGQHVADHGGDPELVEEAFKHRFAERLGWSSQQFEEFWNDTSREFTPDGARKFDETYDAWEWMIRKRN